VGVRLAILLALLVGPGCFWATTKDEGNTIRKDIAKLDQRVAKQEESIDQRVAQLDESLEKATKLLARNSADLGTDVDSLRDEQGKVNGKIEEQNREIGALRAELESLKAENARLRADYDVRLASAEARLAALDGGKAPVVAGGGQVTQPAQPGLSADQLYARAGRSLGSGQVSDARRDYLDFIKRFPNDGRADEAQLGLGDSYVKEKAYEKAIGEYQKVIDVYPTGDSADDALYRAGEAALSMKWCVDARAYFGVLVQKHPKSTLVKNAKAKLEYIKKNAGKKAVCAT
jgi:TolA-binding protein